MTKKEKLYADIKKHGQNLNNLFNTGIDDITLCKKLFRLERKAHQLALDYCNGENGVNTDNWDALCEPILKKVYSILKPENADLKVFLNGDARGYALKIKFDDTDARSQDIYRDWGNFGIIAPDFRS